MVELLPCPFCGGKPFVYTSGNESCGFFEEIICEKCGCRTNRMKEGEAKDIWRIRYRDSQSDTKEENANT